MGHGAFPESNVQQAPRPRSRLCIMAQAAGYPRLEQQASEYSEKVSLCHRAQCPGHWNAECRQVYLAERPQKSGNSRLKLSVDPLVYAFDSPGVMLPFLGQGQKGAERGVKLALIAGIKEGMYDIEALAGYLLYRLNVLNPIYPAYLTLLQEGTPPTTDLHQYLSALAKRMGMIKRGAELDLARAASHFVRWWREEGGLLAASSAPQLGGQSHLSQLDGASATQGWGFDFEWTVSPTDSEDDRDGASFVQRKMEACIENYIVESEKEEREEQNISSTQRKKQLNIAEKAKRKMKHSRR
ncbi:hypothetical protein E1B28_006209 [Marasmius oreades]|uniref:Uncharacterized protein n=1 Tax=Marasmius oreades TaxID=181124 RepID=A0A9P7S4T3_9AGAR|nr:uncharacterized protein E1B28_006209 [Marasmius oreades]KAG7095469.1 hypothetical protein E1B28_006209 [Marasmius oreades]